MGYKQAVEMRWRMARENGALLRSLSGVPVRAVTRAGEEIFSAGWPALPEGCEEALVTPLLHREDSNCLPRLQTSPVFGAMASIGVRELGRAMGTLLLGPVFPGELNETAISHILAPLNISVVQKTAITAYYRAIPAMDCRALVDGALLVYNLMYGEQLTLSKLMEQQPIFPTIEVKKEGPFLRREEEPRLFSEPALQKILRCIREGAPQELARQLRELPQWNLATLAHEPLRSLRNQLIAVGALAMQSAVRAGIGWEEACGLYEYYVLFCEEVSDPAALTGLFARMLQDFAARVQALQHDGYSATVRLCMQYIQAHLYERIRVEEVAAHVQRNSSYLTQRFRQETGMSVTQYIQQQKMGEAKRLLRAPASSGSLWLMLGYCDQSHFDRVFKKVTGMTPGAYRQQFLEKEGAESPGGKPQRQ